MKEIRIPLPDDLRLLRIMLNTQERFHPRGLDLKRQQQEDELLTTLREKVARLESKQV